MPKDGDLGRSRAAAVLPSSLWSALTTQLNNLKSRLYGAFHCVLKGHIISFTELAKLF